MEISIRPEFFSVHSNTQVNLVNLYLINLNSYS